ncbi:1-acyl-sn-glycerol-3-phosphate acyltransferase [Algoriphagus boseongensis]|uniref:1-acyl-sn-glycerol-3-phosphate acyltransferase n=1 Tax=Algoriphagus boseongensis TaxID=1442587 RepID=A0A4R6T6L4_9BACT|nr:lysophospholipid acyltransferase family protein [Algoriphagus boseongensis]TDQ16598.1 1-acyl-sn-glycerol-3-phosphate acyltransferase [Algoriphagus boseongensis]
MIKFFQWIYTIYSGLLFILLMLIFGLLIVIPILISEKADKISFFFIRAWAGIWSFLSGIRYEIHGLEHLDRSKTYIYIFNHRSFIDAPLIPIAIPQELRALGKKELSRIPFFGWVVGKFAIWVDRSSVESRRASVGKLISILSRGKSVVVAPEGTRNDTSAVLLPFQKGAFRLAVETEIPILPIAVIGADRIMKRGSILLSPGKIRIYFSEPLNPPTQSETAINDFAEKCRNRLEAMILTHE